MMDYHGCTFPVISVHIPPNYEDFIYGKGFDPELFICLVFGFSYSCGYRKAFDEYYNIIHEKYPEITIRGGNYDPPGFNMYFSKVLLVTKLLMIIALMSNFDVFGFLRQPIPSWWRWCTDNKLYACMMIFFLGNMLEAQVGVRVSFKICRP